MQGLAAETGTFVITALKDYLMMISQRWEGWHAVELSILIFIFFAVFPQTKFFFYHVWHRHLRA